MGISERNLCIIRGGKLDKGKMFTYVGKKFPQYTGRKVLIESILANNQYIISLVDEGVMVEDGGVWGVSLLVNNDELK